MRRIYLSIYSISFIFFILFRFILFYLLSFINDQNFSYFFFIYFVIICPVPGCSGMFRDVPGCSGMFHVPGFVDAPLYSVKLRKFAPKDTSNKTNGNLNGMKSTSPLRTKTATITLPTTNAFSITLSTTRVTTIC